MAVYLLVGAVGVPVFAGFKGGLGIVFGETGGYLLAYPLAAAVAGLAARAVANDPAEAGLVGRLCCADAQRSSSSTLSGQPGSP